MNRPSGSHVKSGIFLSSAGPNKAARTWPLRSPLTRVSPDASVRTKSIRWASGDQIAPPIALFSSASNSFRACSPSGFIIQISRSPNLLSFLPKAIALPSGETAHATALSRTLRGEPPCTETVQMLDVFDEKSVGFSLAGWALARNLVLSGNHALEPISHFRLSFLGAIG